MSRFRWIFVGTYTEEILFGTGQLVRGRGKGIGIYRFDTLSGELTSWGLVENVPNPSFLTLSSDGSYLYSVNELKSFRGEPGGAVSAFAVDANNGSLTYLNSVATAGSDPCHLVVNESNGCLYVANYASGSVSIFRRLSNGHIGNLHQLIQHHGHSVNAARQSGPHAHAVAIDFNGRRAIVPDLGLDKLMLYGFNTRTCNLTPHDPPWVETKPGAGPRQIVLHPNGRFAYVANELNSSVTAYYYAVEAGTLTPLETLSTLPSEYAGANSCAEIQISPRGDYVYVSNRGHNSLAVFAVDVSDGTLAFQRTVLTQGKTPRHFCLDADTGWLLVANQESDNIVVFRIGSDGDLTPTGVPVDAPTPVCLTIL